MMKIDHELAGKLGNQLFDVELCTQLEVEARDILAIGRLCHVSRSRKVRTHPVYVHSRIHLALILGFSTLYVVAPEWILVIRHSLGRLPRTEANRTRARVVGSMDAFRYDLTDIKLRLL